VISKTRQQLKREVGFVTAMPRRGRQNAAYPLAAEAASLIEKEILEREYRIMNVECRREKPFKILRFDILLFCGLLFRPGEVSYKRME